MKTICWLLWLVLPGAAMAAHTLAAGSRLVQGLHLKSPNGAYQLEMQPDRNLVLYDVSQTPAQDRRVVWDIKKSDTSRAWACALVMQKDGNLVTYVRPDGASSWNQYFGVGEHYWKTETNGIYGEGDYLLTLRDDGVLEVTLPVLDYNATVWKAGKGVDETRFANAMDDIATTVLSRYKSRIETLVDKDHTFEAAATIKTLLAGTRDQKELRKAIERLSQQVVAAESAIGRAQNPLTAQPSKPGSASPLPLPPAPSPSPSAPEIKGEPSYSFTAHSSSLFITASNPNSFPYTCRIQFTFSHTEYNQIETEDVNTTAQLPPNSSAVIIYSLKGTYTNLRLHPGYLVQFFR